jgi:hypothetical protein
MRVLVSLVFVVILVGVATVDQYRHYYYSPEKRAVTIWKRLGGQAVVIPGRYKGFRKPSCGYIIVPSRETVDILWITDEKLLLSSDTVTDVVNCQEGIQLIDYGKKKLFYDSLYTLTEGGYKRYRSIVDLVSVNIDEMVEYQ